MPYKRNPMRCERICSLSRYVMADAHERAHDRHRRSGSSARSTIRPTAAFRLPEAFLAYDGILRLMQNVTKGLHVNEKIVAKFVAGLSAVHRNGEPADGRRQARRRPPAGARDHPRGLHGGDREDEKRRELGISVAQLAARAGHSACARRRSAPSCTPSRYIGRCPEQVAALTAACRALIGSDAQSAEEIML